MQSVSDDDVRKILLEKPRFELELAAKGVFRQGRCYNLAGVFGPATVENALDVS